MVDHQSSYPTVWAYPAAFKKQREGGYVVTFTDLPGVTEGETEEEAAANAVDLLETALSFYIDDRKPLPAASKLKSGERLVGLSSLGMAKVALYEVMQERGMKRADLARLLGVHQPQVDRLLDLTHASQIEQVQRALLAAGDLTLTVVTRPALAQADPVDVYPGEGRDGWGVVVKRSRKESGVQLLKPRAAKSVAMHARAIGNLRLAERLERAARQAAEKEASALKAG